MKFPSVKTLASGAANTVKRFSFELLFALAGSIAFSIKIHQSYSDLNAGNWCTRVMMMASLGLLLSLAATLFIASRKYPRPKAMLIKVIVAIAGASLLLLLDPDADPRDYIRFCLLCLAFHLLVSFAAYIGTGKIQGFWQFNKVLFLRILTSVLYSGVLYLGLVIAIYATVKLFNIDDHQSHIYGYLFAWIAGIFNTTFFLAGIPIDLSVLDEDFSYPKGLKIFTQYVLIPLATIYFLILLAYEIKIIIEWRLPKGYVSNLILGYAVFGILSILLVYPIREQNGNKWIKTYSRWFYFLMMPLIVLLFLAILARVAPYGVTEQRYFLLALGLWLTFICIYFLVSKKQNIRIIPISLCLVTLLSIYGPTSAFSVSASSQRGILVKIFKKYGKYKEGKLMPMGKSLMKSKDGYEAIAKLDYLVRDDRMALIQPIITRDLKLVSDSLNKDDHSDRFIYSYARREREQGWLANYLGLEKFSDDSGISTIYYDISGKNNGVINIRGYDYMINLTSFDYREPNKISKSLPDTPSVTENIDSDNHYLKLTINGQSTTIDFYKVADSLRNKCKQLKADSTSDYSYRSKQYYYVLDDGALTLTKTMPGYNITIRLNHFIQNTADEKLNAITEITGCILIKKQ